MRIFVSEYVCGGGWPLGCPEGSLAREGRAMLAAIVADLARIPDCHVVTTWDSRLGSFPFEARTVTAQFVSEPAAEERLFAQLVSESDATFVIAPESDRILEQRSRLVENSGGRLLGCSASAVAACADKLRLAGHLSAHRIPTIETRAFDPKNGRVEFEFPIVVKPLDGAGSQDTYLVRHDDDLKKVRTIFLREGSPQAIQQPYVKGTAASIAAVVGSDLREACLFPLALQHQSDDGQFAYLGGRVPLMSPTPCPISELIQQCIDAVNGLCGYVGFDLILPEQRPDEPLLVEINPRLTTSYIGYRALAFDNLAERILFPHPDAPPIRWKPDVIHFSAAGTIGQ